MSTVKVGGRKDYKGFDYKPYGKTKGRFKLMFKDDEGQEQSEIRTSLEEATDSARRYSSPKLGYTNIRIIDLYDESGKEYFFKDGGGVESQYKKGVVLVKSAKASNDNDVYDILNDKWKKYKIVNSRAFDLETPYNRGWIDEGISINVYLLKDTETNKYYWDSDYIEAKKNKMADGGMMDVVNTEVISIKGNIMGTTSLELKIKGMKKYQDFIVYPISADEAGKPITIQSDTRFGYMDLSSGRGLMSQSHSNGAYSYHFSSDRKVPFKISEIDVQKIKQHLSSRAGSKVGNSVVFSDNSGAGMMADGGGVDEDMPVIRTQFEEEEFEYAKGGSVAQYRLVPYKQRMEGYIESVGEKQVVLSTTYDGAWEKANELLSSDKDFDTVYVEKLGKSVLSGKILGSVSLRGIIKYADGGEVKKGSEWAFWAGLLGWGVLSYIGINKK